MMLVVKIEERMAVRGYNQKEISPFSAISSMGTSGATSETPFKTLASLAAATPLDLESNLINERRG